MAASQILSVCNPALVFHKQANIHENVMRGLSHVHKVYHEAVTVSFNKYGSTNTLKKLLEAVSAQAAEILLHISKKI